MAFLEEQNIVVMLTIFVQTMLLFQASSASYGCRAVLVLSAAADANVYVSVSVSAVLQYRCFIHIHVTRRDMCKRLGIIFSL